MAEKPHERDMPPAVTAEVGGEGGTFADETYQESEKQGDRSPGLPRVDQPQNQPPDLRKDD